MATTDRAVDATWLRGCLDVYRRALDTDVVEQLVALKDRVMATQARGGKVIFAGNGASAAISSHAAVDFTKTARVRSVSFNDADLITCFANDYGYERWIERALAVYADRADLIVLVSSSGRSPNVVNAAHYARAHQIDLVALTGFAVDNPLSQLADLSLWVDSRAYNVVEAIHQIWLMSVCDLIVGTMEYSS